MRVYFNICILFSIEIMKGRVGVYMRKSLEFTKKIKVLPVDDNFDHLLGIRELINIETNFEVVATATVNAYQSDDAKEEFKNG